MIRRKGLTRDRLKNILLQYRYERINVLLKSLEVLGKGMTTMDYEALRMANVNLIDKVDERERDLEKYWTTYVIKFLRYAGVLYLTRAICNAISSALLF